MSSYRGVLLFVCGLIVLSSARAGMEGSHTFNVRSFGASGDGVTNDRVAIQHAIDSCALRGGSVLFPPGRYLTGSLVLKSHVDIYLVAGATILGSPDLKDYQEQIPALRSYNDAFLKYSLFYAEKAVDISIRGEGTIDGQGSAFEVTTTVKPDRYMNRPYVIRFVQCRSVRVQGVTLRNSGMWMQHYLGCEDLRIEGIRVFNHSNKNNDMMDIDGCKNVTISDCIGDTDDDGITLKSTSPLVTENVTITNCILSSHCNALKCGTESTGGFRNIVVSNIVVKPSVAETVLTGRAGGISGITLAVVDGGVMEGVTIGNIRIEGPQVPVYIRLGNRARKFAPDAPTPSVGVLRNVMIHDVIATDVGPVGCSISGLSGTPVEDIRLSNFRVTYAGGGTEHDAAKDPPELADGYPESTAWGNLPAYGLYVRHARGIAVTNWRLDYRVPDVRPVMVWSDVENGIVDGLNARVDALAKWFIILENSRGITIRHSNPESRTATFLNVRGERSEHIYMHGNILTNVTRDFVTERKGQIVSQGNLR